MLQCFEDSPEFAKQDRLPFKFKHRLMGHPALSLENLGRVIPALPKDQVYYSSGLLSKSDDFDRAHIEHGNGLTIEQTIENIRTSDSYIMVRSPEVDASFMPVFKELIGDVGALIRRQGVGDEVVNPKLYLFIASPNSLTPFHIDRYSTYLMQFRGSKEVKVFPPGDERVVTDVECENFMAHEGPRPTWKPDSDALGTSFHFAPGEALHIPFVAGHYVKNGADDVSISMSIIFNTRETAHRIRALMFNQRMRPTMASLGVKPSSVGAHPSVDVIKSQTYRAASWLARSLGKGE
ncbi:MAG: transcriptional regulator [Rubrivivax sp.]|nr:MAG: transcriptional regulator [Rubrivivax sp.]